MRLVFAKDTFNGGNTDALFCQAAAGWPSGAQDLQAKRARKMLPQLLMLLEQFAHSPAQALASTLRSWLEPIVRMGRFSKSNGITEGFHTKMKCSRAVRMGSGILRITA
ncbi:MAG TPA: transposase [Nitrosospira sp.]|nr:transposase [Nitrosospira sp.]